MKDRLNEFSEEKYEQGSMPDIFSRINRISKNLDKFQRMVLKETTLTPPQYAILNILADNKDFSLSEIAKLSYSSRPTITNLIDALEKKKLVMRVPNKEDRRSSLVKLTDKGKQLNQEAPSVDHIYADCCSILNPEESQSLSLLLKKLNNALQGYLKFEKKEK